MRTIWRCFHRRSAAGGSSCCDDAGRLGRELVDRRGARSAGSRSIANAPSSRSSTASSECDATVTATTASRNCDSAASSSRRCGCASTRRCSAARPVSGIGRPLERPAHGRAVDDGHRPSVARPGAERRPTVELVADGGRTRSRMRYPGSMPRLRVAAAQINVVVGDLDGQRGAGARGLRGGRGRGLRPRRVPRADGHGLPARGPAAAAGVRRGGGRDARQARGPHRRVRGRDRVPGAGRRPLQRGRGVRGRRGASASTASSCCRTTRCSTSSATSRPSTDAAAAVRHRGRAGRRLDLRGRVERRGPILAEAAGGAELDRQPQRVALLRGPARASARRCSRRARPTRRCRSSTSNLVGGQDELVFDGASLVFDAHGPPRRAREAVRRRPARRRLDVDRSPTCTSRRRRAIGAASHRAALAREVYEALVLGTRDYVRKNGFTDVLISLSGGIDSSLVAAIAVDALGAEHVHGVLHAVALLERGQRHRRRARSPSSLGIAHVHRADRARARRVRADARAGVRGHARPTSPRRTCRRASAATC